jgi:hypothetical protein
VKHVLLASLVLVCACRTRTLEDVPMTDGALTGDGAVVADLRMSSGDLPSPFCQEVKGTKGNSKLQCANIACNSTACCVDQTDNSKQMCMSACQNGFNTFNCDGPEDCMGGACCFNHNGPPPFKAVCAFGFCNGLEVCHSTADCDAGMICRKDAGFPDGVGSCQPPC